MTRNDVRVPEGKLRDDDEPGETVTDESEENSRSIEEPAVNVMKNDIHWGRKTLHKFFWNLASVIIKLN